MKRENGFYWVKKYGKWVIGKWQNDPCGWFLFGYIEDLFSDNELDTINETRILPPQ